MYVYITIILSQPPNLRNWSSTLNKSQRSAGACGTFGISCVALTSGRRSMGWVSQRQLRSSAQMQRVYTCIMYEISRVLQTDGWTSVKARSHRMNAWRTHEERTENWFVRHCLSSFVTLSSSALHQRFWFVTIRLVCRASRTILSMFMSMTYKCTRQKNAGHARGAIDQRPICAQHSLGIRCVFVRWDVANTYRELSHTCALALRCTFAANSL